MCPAGTDEIQKLTYICEKRKLNMARLDKLKLILVRAMHKRLSKVELDLIARILGAKVINSSGSCYYSAALTKCITMF